MFRKYSIFILLASSLSSYARDEMFDEDKHSCVVTAYANVPRAMCESTSTKLVSKTLRIETATWNECLSWAKKQYETVRFSTYCYHRINGRSIHHANAKHVDVQWIDSEMSVVEEKQIPSKFDRWWAND